MCSTLDASPAAEHARSAPRARLCGNAEVLPEGARDRRRDLPLAGRDLRDPRVASDDRNQVMRLRSDLLHAELDRRDGRGMPRWFVPALVQLCEIDQHV